MHGIEHEARERVKTSARANKRTNTEEARAREPHIPHALLCLLYFLFSVIILAIPTPIPAITALLHRVSRWPRRRRQQHALLASHAHVDRLVQDVPGLLLVVVAPLPVNV